MKTKNSAFKMIEESCIENDLLMEAPCVVLVCTVLYTAVCSSAVFVLFRMNSGPCLKIALLKMMDSAAAALSPPAPSVIGVPTGI